MDINVCRHSDVVTKATYKMLWFHRDKSLSMAGELRAYVNYKHKVEKAHWEWAFESSKLTLLAQDDNSKLRS